MKMTLDEAIETLNKAGCIAEGVYKDLIHTRLGELRDAKLKAQQDSDSKEKRNIRIMNKVFKEVKEFVNDLENEVIDSDITCSKEDWDIIVKIDWKEFKIYCGLRDYAFYVPNRATPVTEIPNDENLRSNLPNFLETIFEALTKAAS